MYIDTAMSILSEDVNRYESVLYQFEIIRIAIDAGLYEKALQISEISEELMEENINIGKWVKLMGYRIEIYEALGCTDELSEAYKRYFEYDTIYEEEKKQAAVTRIRRKIELIYEIDRKKQIEQRQAALSDKRSNDELTGLYIATADVDFFKEYNDTYGHIAGDMCLKCVADILRQNIGDEGIICRYGGDEFLCVMSNISQAQAEQLFSKISAGLADKYIENSQSGVSDRVTISIGAVIAKQSAAMDFETLIHEADMALYEVKNNSKNGYRVKRVG